MLETGSAVGLTRPVTLVHKDGTEIPVDQSLAPIRQSGGDPLGLVLVFRDVRDRRRAEHALRESEAQFRQLADAMPQLAWMTRPDGHIVWYNRRWYEYTGTTPAQMEGWGWQSVHDPAELPRVLANWRAALARGEPWEDIFPLRRHDGQMRWHLSRALPVTDDRGQVVRWFGTNTDVTEQRRAAEALRASEERLRAALAASGTGTFRWDLRTGALEFDESLNRLFGLPPGEAVRTLEQFAECVHPEDRAAVVETCRRCAAEGADFNLDYRVVWPDGGIHWLADRGKTFFDAAGKPTYMTGACVDITAHKRLEEALREADRRKDEFLATLAHELRNPLAPIGNALQILRLADADPARRATARAMMERQLGQMVRLVDDLLDVSRITRGKIELRRERLPLADVVKNALETTQPAIAAARHELTVDLPPEPIVVEGDLTRLAQVLANLLMNAAKYTKDGGQIRLAARREGAEAVIDVTDNGMGIPPEMLGQIFDMFTQVDRTLDRSQGGLGIGLTLVKRLVEMHGGTITARSAGAGRGSTFTVRLPLLKDEGGRRKDEHDPVHPSSFRLHPLKVLVVDDSVDSAESLADIVALWGNEVRLAHDGPAAIEAARIFHPDVVLLDLGMPGMSGYDVARRLRAMSTTRRTVLVAQTGWGQGEDRRRTKEAGFDHHLVKPIDPRALEALLASLAPNREAVS